MITTKGVYHIGIPVNDVERAVKFYTEILGMTIAKLNRDDMGDHLNRADLRSGEALARFGALVRARVSGWFAGAGGDEFTRVVETYWGPVPAHDLLEAHPGMYGARDHERRGGAQAQARAHRHAPPAEEHLAFLGDDLLEQRDARLRLLRLLGQEDHADAVGAGRRECDALGAALAAQSEKV